jgi:two-component system, OmpR family, KDP operon response regulator KdpE
VGEAMRPAVQASSSGPSRESAKGPTVVVIEDEPQMRRFLRATLVSLGYRFHEAATGQDGLVEAATRQPDVIILDLGLPDLDGLEIIRRVREWSTVPIIVLSARDQEDDMIKALDLGANDYVSKPFGVGQLLARLRAVLRHAALASQQRVESVFTAGALRVDLMRRRVSVGGAEVHLTPTEYRLLTALVRHAGLVVIHQQLLREVWGPNHEDQANYLRVFMLQLRRKIEADPARPRYLRTEPGVGYRLMAD